MIQKSNKSVNWTKNFLSNKTIGIIGYDPIFSKNYALNIRDNNYNIFTGTNRYSYEWNNAIKDEWMPDYNLFSIDELTYKTDILFYLLPKYQQKNTINYILENMNNDKLLCYEEIFDDFILDKNINLSQIRTNDTHYMLRFNFLHKYENIETNIKQIKNINQDINIYNSSIALSLAFGSDIVNINNTNYYL